MNQRNILIFRAIFLLLWIVAGIFVFTDLSVPGPGSVVAQTKPQQRELTAEERRGKEIYFEGRSGSDEIIALMGDDSIEVPASVMTCSNCHGWDGEGRNEGGLSAGNITWSYLTKPHVHEGTGRKHPAFTGESLKNAIALGVDPGGNRLHIAMPRYRMSQQRMSDLIAFVKRLETEQPPLSGVWQVTATNGDKSFTFYLFLELRDRIGGESKYADWAKVTGRKADRAEGAPAESDRPIVFGAWKDGTLGLLIDDENGRMVLQGKLTGRKLSGEYGYEDGKTRGNWVAVHE